MEKLTYSGSPHIRCSLTTKKIMIQVCIALLPACIMGCIYFGLYALLILAIASLSAVVTEFAYKLLFNKKAFKQAMDEFDYTSLVTGILVGMNMPPVIPVYVPILTSIFAIAVVKMIFGGTGKNIFNPAIAGRIFAFLSFTTLMTKSNNFSSGMIPVIESGATPFTDFLNGNLMPDKELLFKMFIGYQPGYIGETCKAALLLGAIYLAVMGIIDIKMPLITIAITGLMGVAFNNFNFAAFLPSILGGGLMLGALFMATDYTTTPNTKKGQYLYFSLLGILIGLLRYSKATDRVEAVSYAIMMMNMLVPIFDKYIINKPFGYVKPEKKKEGAK